MNKKQIIEWLEHKPGYKKEGAQRLLNLLIRKGYNVQYRSVKNALKESRRLQKYKSIKKDINILIYDIETSRATFSGWWTGKQYVNSSQLLSEPKVITIAYKWLGSNEVYKLKWNKKQSDKKLISTFLKEYNKADMVIGFNNDSFDNRWINARALKYNLEVNTFIKSFDIMKQAKRLFRLPGYSMNFIAKYVGVETKLQHSGLQMWEAIQFGDKKEAKKAMKLMLKYNVQDIIVTEQVYLRLRKYMYNQIHVGVLQGKKKSSCPICGSENVKHFKTITTKAGTIQHIMKCKEDKLLFKISNTEYLKNIQ